MVRESKKLREMAMAVGNESYEVSVKDGEQIRVRISVKVQEMAVAGGYVCMYVRA